jgi:predicted small secreted protein
MTRMRTRALSVLLLSLLALLLAGCPPRESIAKINQDPARFAGKDISIAGHVTDSFGALGTGVFQIDDGTGTMWVFSKRYGVPGNGAKLAVTGRIQQGFAFGGRNFATILRETERRH